ncbi:acyl-carrier-protein S-malonyltransferase, putative [Babesia caballi]|uniref:Acyl-carrier-protein S-malonyltransferase, putative n=1 Tax=Babesia caballi TaxID=5871 RepID=A0AAV4LS36_BABCB|nr:acyl-carrier-protein S-malonyltransferase, putative [Babesia caballi]
MVPLLRLSPEPRARVYDSIKKRCRSPLTASYIAAKHYFTLQFAKDETSDETLKAIKANLEAFKKSCGLLYGDLKAEISTLLPNVTVTDKSAVSESDTASTSPAGAVAGTLTTIGLGGAAAAYVFNLGGAKPFVNGLLRIG